MGTTDGSKGPRDLGVDGGVKLRILKMGRPATPEAAELFENYFARLRAFCSAEHEEWRVDESRRYDPFADAPQKLAGAYTIVLDEKGKQSTSKEFAQQLKRLQEDPAIKTVVFLVGGPFGFTPEALAQANKRISFSNATLPSDLAWVLLVEQIYRGFSILKGMPYHHE